MTHFLLGTICCLSVESSRADASLSFHSRTKTNLEAEMTDKVQLWKNNNNNNNNNNNAQSSERCDFTTAEHRTRSDPSKEAVVLVPRTVEIVASFNALSLHVGGESKNTIHHSHKLRCYYLNLLKLQVTTLITRCSLKNICRLPTDTSYLPMEQYLTEIYNGHEVHPLR